MANQQFFSFMEVPARSHECPAGDLTLPQAGGLSSAGGDATSVRISKRDATKAEAAPPDRDSLLKKLRAEIGCVTVARPSSIDTFSTGCTELDQMLPIGGLHPATLTDWVAAHDSAAAGSLATLAAAHRLRQVPAMPLMIVDCEGTFYPPAAMALGIPAERMVLVRPNRGADAIWAIDQALRSGSVAAVWAALPMRLDDRDARRLQLASEFGRTPGLLVRGFHDRGRPSFSEVQFYVSEKRRPVRDQSVRVSPGRRRLVSERVAASDAGHGFETIEVTLDRVRGGIVGRQLEIQIDDAAVIHSVSPDRKQRYETAAQHLAAQLAHPAKVAGRSTGNQSRSAPSRSA